MFSVVGNTEVELSMESNFSLTHVMLLLLITRLLSLHKDNEAGIFASKLLLSLSDVEEKTVGILFTASVLMILSKSLFLSRQLFDLLVKALEKILLALISKYSKYHSKHNLSSVI